MTQSDNEVSVPQSLRVAIDVDMRHAIQEFVNQTKAPSISAALRSLLSLGLTKSSLITETIKRSAFREGLILGIREIKSRMSKSISNALDGLSDDE